MNDVRCLWMSVITGLLPISAANAVPPLLSGDAPTAEKQGFELYTGVIYESEGGGITRSFPSVELNYGISDRQEVTVQFSWLSENEHKGWGEVFLETKYMFVKETKSRPGIAGSFELKCPTASSSRGLGTGAFDENMLLRVQKTWDWFTLLGNAGYTFLGDPKPADLNFRDGAWFFGLVQEYQVSKHTKVFAELFLETNEERGGPARLAANVGFEHEIRHDFEFQAAVAKSLRGERQGGPDLRVYLGFHWVFDAPWKRSDSK